MPYLHHVAIHFPIALTMLAALCAGLAQVGVGSMSRDARRWLAYLAAASALVAITSGLLSASHVGGEIDDIKVARHRNVALLATALSVTTAILGWVGHRRSSGALVRTSEIGSIVVAAVVGLAGHLGGDMLHPGLAPWSTEAHSHGMAHDHEDHDEGAIPAMSMTMPPSSGGRVEDSGSNGALPIATSSTAATTIAPPPAHSHGGAHAPPPNPSITATTATATATAPPPTASAPPTATVPPPPMTGMPPGHKM